MHKIFRFALIFALALVVALPVAPVWAGKFRTKAKYAILIDANTGSVLFEKKADVLMPPASMSKLVTVALIFDALKRGELRLEDQVIFSVNAWRNGGAPSGTSAMMVPLNKSVSIDELLKGIIVQSGNDACIAVAEHMAGTEEVFADRMMQYMRKIGLNKSTFGNPTGLPHPKQRMTARELALLAIHLIKTYPEFYHYFSIKNFKYRRHTFYNRNPLVYAPFNADGLKTGHTKEAGYGLVASMVKKGRRLVAVISGAKSKRDRKSEAWRLLQWGFSSFKRYQMFAPDQTIGYARVLGGEKYSVALTGKGVISVMRPRKLKSRKVDAKIVYNGPLKAPVRAGDQVAFLYIKNKSGSYSQVPLYARENVEQATPFWRGIDSLLFMAFGWIY